MLSCLSSQPLRDVSKLGLGRLRLAAAGRYEKKFSVYGRDEFMAWPTPIHSHYMDMFLHKDVKWKSKPKSTL
jgi:hypothetical protein